MKNGHEPKEGRKKHGCVRERLNDKFTNITKHNKAYMTLVFHHSLSTFHIIRHLVILHTQLQRVQTVGVQS